MLSIQTLRGGSGGQLASYFEKESAQKDYWAREAKEATCWHGQGAERLGLSGPVDQRQFEELVEGKLPNGKELSHGAGGKRRLGYDLTFSAPKSVSLQALVAEDSRIVGAHDAAVKEAVGFLEQEAAQCRIKKAGETSIEKTDNLTVAAFRHDTSRNLDPQLHTHCVTPNLTLDKEGRARALDASEVFRNKMAAGAVYRGELARNLKELGYEIKVTDPKQGMFEIEGYSQKQLDRFSTRRAEIEGKLKSADHPDSPRAAEQAALSTRQRKQEVKDRQALRETWKEAGEKAGVRLQIPAKSAKPQLSPEASKMRARRITADAFSDLRRSRSTSTFQQMRGRALQRAVGQKTTAKDIKVEFAEQWQKRINTGRLAKLDNGRYMDPRPVRRSSLRPVTRAVADKFTPKPIQEVKSAWHKVKLAARVIEGVKDLKSAAKALRPKPLQPGQSMGKAVKSPAKAVEKAVGKVVTGGLKR